MKTSQQLLQNGAAAVFCAHTINRWNIFLGAQTGKIRRKAKTQLDQIYCLLLQSRYSSITKTGKIMQCRRYLWKSKENE
jgi:hypothetical protein